MNVDQLDVKISTRVPMNYQPVAIIAISEACGFLDSPKIERRFWVHPERESCGRFKMFYNDVRNCAEKFLDYYQMTVASFDELLNLVRNQITKQHTNFRNPISTEERLTITLRFLSIGTTLSALQNEFNVGRSTMSKIVRETCQALWTVLKPLEMPEPTLERWLEISNTFHSNADFPNCIGILNGKHLRCMNPKKTGSIFYKKYFSNILMAVVDADYCFINVDVVKYERHTNMFKNSPFGKKIYNKKLNLPKPKCLPNTSESPQPFVFIANEAFSLLPNVLRPYAERTLTEKHSVFNYRLSRTKRLAECAFGILSNKWHVCQGNFSVEPDFVEDIVKACCVLHNFVRRRDGVKFEDTLYSHMDNMEVTRTGSRSEGRHIREFFTNYFMTDGAIPLQNQVLNTFTK